MSEWIRHRGSKSMPKCLEGKRFEVRYRNGEIVDQDEPLRKDFHAFSWENAGYNRDIMAYRITGDINSPDYSKGFPVGTTAKDIGAKVEDEFVVAVDNGYGYFKLGERIKLIEDDGSACPLFSNGTESNFKYFANLSFYQPKTAIELQAEEVGIPEPVRLVDDDTHLGIKRPAGDGWVKYNAGDVVDLDGVVSIDWRAADGQKGEAMSWPREFCWLDGKTNQIAWYRLNYGDASQHYASEQQAAEADKRIDDAAQGVRESVGIAPTANKYQRTIKGVTVDVYDVLAAFGVTCQARGHAIKKLLMAGQRGHKDEAQDLHEAVQAIERSIQLTEGK